jgi:ribosomal protein S18 acetylase RimI-like enzyme
MKSNIKPIITIHGIRKQEEWDLTFKNLDAWSKKSVDIINFDYGFLSIWGFLNPRRRNRIIADFQKFYSEQNFHSENLPHVVCHSFGSYIFYQSILKYSSIKFDKVILCGSILNHQLDWKPFIDSGQVQTIYNDYGILDWVVRHSRTVLKHGGKSGEVGFHNIAPPYKSKVINRKNYFEHSDYFLPQHMRDNWVQVLFPNNFAYQREILRDDVIQRIYSNIEGRQSDLIGSSVKYLARIDKEGHYYANYVISGSNQSNGNVSAYTISTTADSIQDFDEMDFQAIDSAGKLLDVENIRNLVQNKHCKIHFNEIIHPGEGFTLSLRFMWKATISLKSGDTDHFEIHGYKTVNISLNFPCRLRSARYYIVANHILIQQVEAITINERDGTFTYSLNYDNNANYDGVIFYFEGANMNQGSNNKSLISKIENVTISKCTLQDIADIYKIELDVEHSNAASEQTLKDRLQMFPDGFLVAKENGKIIGYVESVLWNNFEFSTFDEIKNFPLHYNVKGQTLYVIFIAVKEEFRRKGIAKLLLNEIEKVANKYGANTIQLVAKDDLVTLYNKSGFRSDKELANFLPNSQYKSVLMHKSI